METLKCKQFGSDNGRIVIYFHGAPSSPDECEIFERDATAHQLTFICFDRFAVDSSLTGAAYYQFLAAEILKKAAGKQVDVVGFSIGAFVALQTCRYLGENVRNLHLISAAAPLEAGDFLATMAGKRVFQLAKIAPVLFLLLSYWQGLLALFFPKALFQLLFASSTGKDKALTANREFQSSLTAMLKSCFVGRISGYVRDMKAYVSPWSASLADMTVHTHIWHGAEDNWSPKAMASYLASAIPQCVQIEIVAELSHYSCLYHSAPKICQQLSNT
jgi:pimeloyl-ACP methyl ester carboxylesterase